MHYYPIVLFYRPIVAFPKHFGCRVLTNLNTTLFRNAANYRVPEQCRVFLLFPDQL